MSASFYWCLCAISEEEYKALKQKSISAREQFVIKKKYHDAYKICKDFPLKILPKFIPYNELPEEKRKQKLYKNGYMDIQLLDNFSLSLYIPQYQNIFKELPLNEKDVIKFISLKGITPISVLYYALGPEIAEKLPGQAGNMILNFNEIEQTYEQVNKVLLSLNKISWDRARKYLNICGAELINQSYHDEIKEIFEALPKSLEEAKKRRKGFASVITREF